MKRCCHGIITGGNLLLLLSKIQKVEVHVSNGLGMSDIPPKCLNHVIHDCKLMCKKFRVQIMAVTVAGSMAFKMLDPGTKSIRSVAASQKKITIAIMFLIVVSKKLVVFYATINSVLSLRHFIVCSNLIPSPEEHIVALAMMS